MRPPADMKAFDRASWEERWSRVLRDHPDQVAHRPANAHLTAAVESLRPGLALDAGCGHGSDTLWLAARGWRVTAVDFSATALAHGRSRAEGLGAAAPRRVGLSTRRVPWHVGPIRVRAQAGGGST